MAYIFAEFQGLVCLSGLLFVLQLASLQIKVNGQRVVSFFVRQSDQIEEGIRLLGFSKSILKQRTISKSTKTPRGPFKRLLRTSLDAQANQNVTRLGDRSARNFISAETYFLLFDSYSFLTST